MWAAAAAVLASGLVVLLVHGALAAAADLALARALAAGGVSPGLRLDVVLLAGLVAVIGRPLLAAGVLLVLAAAATGTALGRIAPRLGLSRWPPVVTVLAVVVNPALRASIGTPLAVALLAALGLGVVARRPLVTGLLGGLLLLMRADLAPFALAGIVAVLLTCGVRAAIGSTAVTVVVGVAWYAAAGLPDLPPVEPGLHVDPLVATLALAPAAIGLLALLARVAGRTGVVDPLHVVWGVGALLHVSTDLLGYAAWSATPAVGALTMLAGLGVSRPSPRAVVLGALAALVVITGADLAMRPSAPDQVRLTAAQAVAVGNGGPSSGPP